MEIEATAKGTDVISGVGTVSADGAVEHRADAQQPAPDAQPTGTGSANGTAEHPLLCQQCGEPYKLRKHTRIPDPGFCSDKCMREHRFETTTIGGGEEELLQIEELVVGDYVVHYQHGMAQFMGLVAMTLTSKQDEYMVLQFAGRDKIYLPIDQAPTRLRRAAAHIEEKLDSLK